MLKKKKNLLSILLLSIYALFLAQEITVTTVMCYKNNGSRDIELAFFSFRCECKNECLHAHPCPQEPENNRQFSPECFECFDLPLDNTWLKRIITPVTVKINLLKQYDLDHQIDLQLNDPFKRLFEGIPLSKFLYKPFFPTGSVILRC